MFESFWIDEENQVYDIDIYIYIFIYLFIFIYLDASYKGKNMESALRLLLKMVEPNGYGTVPADRCVSLQQGAFSCSSKVQKSSKKRGVLPFYSLNHETLCCPPVSYPPVLKLSFETVCINKSPHPSWKSQEAEMEQSMQALEPQGDGGYGLYGRHHKTLAKV